MPDTIIAVNDFSYIYPNTQNRVLENITFTVSKGDFIGILGCNKAGKSTLCQSLVGVLPYLLGGSWEGDVIVDGVNLDETKGAKATDVIGIVFQDAESQFTQETVEDEIAFAMCNFGYARELMTERIKIASTACGLRDMLDRSPFRLSGGQQQRLAVACVLALQPQVVILDESTSQLDPIGRDEVFTLVSELNQNGTTIIMVDHNIEKIAQYVNKVMVLHEGKLVAYDDTSVVFQMREELNRLPIRIPEVTEASLRLKDDLGLVFDNAPLNLDDAEKLFRSAKKEGGLS